MPPGIGAIVRTQETVLSVIPVKTGIQGIWTPAGVYPRVGGSDAEEGSL
jgi:hypothetical protein